jgi:imidazolonepropionase-like amidohydrolase
MRTLAAIAIGLLLYAPAKAETLAITGARAMIGGAAPVEHTTIIVRDGRIVAAAQGLAPPAGARIIDAEGRLVTPGLMNAGTQLGLLEVSSLPDTSDESVGSGPLGAAFDVQYGVNPNSLLIPQARADGLTRAGAYPGGSGGAPFLGQAVALRLSEGPDVIDRPRALMFAQVGGLAAGRTGGSRAAAWELLRNALAEAKAFRAPIGVGAPRDQLLNRLDLEALQPVVTGRTALAILADRESDLREAVRLSDDLHVRVVIFGGAEAWRVADLLAARHIPVVLDPLVDLPATFDQMGARADNAARLGKAGVTLAFTAPGIHFSLDAGEAVREGAGVAVANGLPWADAIKALTSGAAEIWGLADHYGRIAPGQDADLVIWDGDPLEPASAPVAVFVRGREVSLRTRQTALRDRYAPAKAAEPWAPAYR